MGPIESKLALAPVMANRRQAIIWTNDGWLSTMTSAVNELKTPK